MDLGKNLSENLRKRRGKISQAVYAKKLGISVATLNRLENATQNTTLATLQQIMKALKCKPSDLLE